MNIIYICTTIILSSVIFAVVIYKSFNKLSSSIDKMQFNFTINRENISSHNIKTETNNSNLYEQNIKNSMMEMQSKIFDKPIATSGEKIKTNSKDDDIDDLSKQLKGMK